MLVASLAADCQDRTMRVPNHRIRNAPQERSLQPAAPAATQNHQAGLQLLAKPYDLRIRPAERHVDPRDPAASLPYLRRFLIDPLASAAFEGHPKVVLGIGGIDRVLGETVSVRGR